MTDWAKDVNPHNVWQEYPRPLMVRETWQNLNGLWEYAIVPREQSAPESWDGEILVPFCVESALSGVMKRITPDDRLWYRRVLDLPDGWDSQRILLHFGAVDWEATVWVNGVEVGTHRGGYDPFTFDITDALGTDGNELVVAVWDPTDNGYQPRGKQVLEPHGIWYTPVTGIWQTVWLEPVPVTSIQSIDVTPDVDASVVHVAVGASDSVSACVQALQDGGVLSELEVQAGESIALPVPEPRLWSPDDPYLYDLKISLASGDSVASYFGMRKIEMHKDESGINRLFLNDEPLFQYGPLDQGWWPDGLYTAPCDDALRYDVEVTKQFGMNMARKHVKVEPQRWYYWCDKLGLLVWQDMPSGSYGNEGGPANYEQELKRMINCFANHPSIVMWVPFNEGWGQHDTERYTELVRQWDSTRTIDNPSGWTDVGVGDVHDVHSYPGPAMPPLEEKRAAVLGEFGGLGLPLQGHTWQDEKNWGYRSYPSQEELTQAYVELLGNVRPLIGQGLTAAIYTQTTDVEVEVNGLLTYDRKVHKLDIGRATEAAQKLYLPPPIIETCVPTSQQTPQTWNYSVSDPGENWFAEDFDDSSWQSGPGGFGTEGTPGAVIGTEWNTDDIWVRRTFELADIEAETRLLIHHDEDAQVYLNGELIAELRGHTSNYVLAVSKLPLDRVLRIGENTLAVHCHQTTGGQYIDVGLVSVRERE